MRDHSIIIQKMRSASAGDIVLAIDLSPAKNEVHQYKNFKRASFILKLGVKRPLASLMSLFYLHKIDSKHEARW